MTYSRPAHPTLLDTEKESKQEQEKSQTATTVLPPTWGQQGSKLSVHLWMFMFAPGFVCLSVHFHASLLLHTYIHTIDFHTPSLPPSLPPCRVTRHRANNIDLSLSTVPPPSFPSSLPPSLAPSPTNYQSVAKRTQTKTCHLSNGASCGDS